jgi:hypothetical protein
MGKIFLALAFVVTTTSATALEQKGQEQQRQQQQQRFQEIQEIENQSPESAVDHHRGRCGNRFRYRSSRWSHSCRYSAGRKVTGCVYWP